jgi:glycerol uptake facilitator protein
MDPRLFGEFMGTLVLVLLGDAVVANVVLKKTLGENSGWPVITSGYALAVVAGVFTAIACGSSGAHINPAVTLAFAIVSGNFSDFFPFFIAQVLGAFAGGIFVWLHFMPHWAATAEPGKKLAVFCTGPAIPNTIANLISEVIGTFALVLIIASIFSKAVGGPAVGLGPFLVGATVWAIGSGLGGTTGFAINPARDLGPRIAHAILPIPGKGSSEFGYGGALAGLFIKVAGI